MKRIGLFNIIIWCVFSAFARVFTNQQAQYVDYYILCFYTFMIAEAIFLMMGVASLTRICKKCVIRSNLKDVALLNISTFAAWFFLIYPLKYIEPAVVSTITMGVLPISTLLLGLFVYKKKKFTKIDGIICTALFLVSVYSAFCCFFMQYVRLATIKNIVYSICCCVVVGVATTLQNIYAKKLSDKSFKALEILIIRFPLLIFISAIFTVIHNKSIYINSIVLQHIMILSISLVVIPLYMVQMALRYLDPITISIVSPLMPICVYFFEYFYQGFHPSASSVLATITTICILLIGLYKQFKR